MENYLVIIGDSHLARLNRTLETNVTTYLQDNFPGMSLIDFSSGGANTRDGVKVIKEKELPENSTCLLLFGTNDAAGWKEVPLEEYKSNLEKIITSLVDKQNKVIILTPPPVNETKQIPPGRSNEVLAKYAQTVMNVASEQGITCIDLFSTLKDSMQSEDIHESDGVHLNEQGYKILLQLIKEVLN